MALRTFALALAASFVTAAVSADDVVVGADNAQLVRLPGDAAAIVLGNPSIADTTLYDTRTLFVTGKSYGTTNLIALDAAGEILFQTNVRVVQPTDGLVFVYRNLERQSYHCAETCDPTAIIGDSNTNFQAVAGQLQSRIQTSSGAGGNQRSGPPAGN